MYCFLWFLSKIFYLQVKIFTFLFWYYYFLLFLRIGLSQTSSLILSRYNYKGYPCLMRAECGIDIINKGYPCLILQAIKVIPCLKSYEIGAFLPSKIFCYIRKSFYIPSLLIFLFEKIILYEMFSLIYNDEHHFPAIYLFLPPLQITLICKC